MERFCINLASKPSTHTHTHYSDAVPWSFETVDFLNSHLEEVAVYGVADKTLQSLNGSN